MFATHPHPSHAFGAGPFPLAMEEGLLRGFFPRPIT